MKHKSTISEVLPAGVYNVSVSDGSDPQLKTVDIKPGSDTVLEFSGTSGRVELSAGLSEDGGLIEDVTFVISEDDPDSPEGRREIARSRSPTPSFTLPAGTYYASARSGGGEVRQRIAVGAGDVVKRALILPLVPVRISALIGGEPVTESHGIAYRVTEIDGDRRELARSVQSTLQLDMLPGRYRVAAYLNTHHLKAAQDVTVEADKKLNVELKFDAGEVNLKPAAALAGAGTGDTYWEILDPNGKTVWRALTPQARALLAPGRYRVRLESRERQSEVAFEIRSGERKVVEIAPQ